MRRVLFVTAAVVAAVIVFALATLPPQPAAADTSAVDADVIRRTVRGAYHVHTSRSDGASDKATIAAAAARAGLKFVIFTDHGDGTAPADPPAYSSGVLCIDGVEISTNGGHYVALDMPQAPYPLGGDPSTVVEDVRRLGGFGIAAHPDSPKASLAWTDWDAPIDGIEWLNADSEWRDETRSTLAAVLLHYLFRPAPALASLLDRPVRTLERWDALNRRRRVVALAAHDAHGGMGRGAEEGGVRKSAIGGVPSYEASFRTFANNVVLEAPLIGDGARDSAAVMEAIRRGSVYTVIDAIAAPGYIDVRPLDSGGMQMTVQVKTAFPPRGQLVIFANGTEMLHSVHSSGGIGLSSPAGPVRVEVFGAAERDVGPAPIPWILTNPLYLTDPPSAPAPPDVRGELIPLPVVGWHVEKDPRSAATVAASTEQSLRYTLAPGARQSQFVALAADLSGGLAAARQIVFTASATRPSRVSVQLRYRSRGGERWGSSVYVDPAPRDVVVPIERMRPLDRQAGSPPDPATASSLLLVVDLTNARPGDTNRLTVTSLGAAR